MFIYYNLSYNNSQKKKINYGDQIHSDTYIPVYIKINSTELEFQLPLTPINKDMLVKQYLVSISPVESEEFFDIYLKFKNPRFSGLFSLEGFSVMNQSDQKSIVPFPRKF